VNAHIAPAASRDESQITELTHDLRAALNGIKSWAQVLESVLEDPDPMVARAIEGILIGVDQQVALIERMEHPERKG
jgi:signal transduction histidine kinase